MSAHNDGWRIDFGGAGRLRLLMSEGHNDTLDVAADDFLHLRSRRSGRRRGGAQHAGGVLAEALLELRQGLGPRAEPVERE